MEVQIILAVLDRDGVIKHLLVDQGVTADQNTDFVYFQNLGSGNLG